MGDGGQVDATVPGDVNKATGREAQVDKVQLQQLFAWRASNRTSNGNGHSTNSSAGRR